MQLVFLSTHPSCGKPRLGVIDDSKYHNRCSAETPSLLVTVPDERAGDFSLSFALTVIYERSLSGLIFVKRVKLSIVPLFRAKA